MDNKINTFFKNKKKNINYFKNNYSLKNDIKNLKNLNMNTSKNLKSKYGNYSKIINNKSTNNVFNSSIDNVLNMKFGSISSKNSSKISNIFQSTTKPQPKINASRDYTSKLLNIKDNIQFNIKKIKVNNLKTENLKNSVITNNISLYNKELDSYNNLNSNKSKISKGNFDFNIKTEYEEILVKIQESIKYNKLIIYNFKKNYNEYKSFNIEKFSKKYIKSLYDTWDKYLLKYDFKNRDILLNEVFKFDKLFNKYFLIEIKIFFEEKELIIFNNIIHNTIRPDSDFFNNSNIFFLKNQYINELEINKHLINKYEKSNDLYYKDIYKLKYRLESNKKTNFDFIKKEFWISISNNKNILISILENSKLSLKKIIKNLNKIDLDKINNRSKNLSNRVNKLEKTYKYLLLNN